MATISVKETGRFVTLGMFIIDEFSYLDEDGNKIGRSTPAQIGGGGTYAAIGSRIWLPPSRIGMIVDRGHDFPPHIQNALDSYGHEMWLFRDDKSRSTTRALNAYRGEERGFQYLTPRVRITPRDLERTLLSDPMTIHFICSPTRANVIVQELKTLDWGPVTVYEPIPYRCVPEELPALRAVLPYIDVLSPNADEALALLSQAGPPEKGNIQSAALAFLEFGVGKAGSGTVVIRSGALGACIASRQTGVRWVDAYWSGPENASKVVDVTGAGNSFLGGFAAGLMLKQGNVLEAVLHGTVSASYVIEQEGLPKLSYASDDLEEIWNGESPSNRLANVRERANRSADTIVQH